MMERFVCIFALLTSKYSLMKEHQRVQFLVMGIVVFLLFLTGCSKKVEEPPPVEPVIPVLTTAPVTDISQTSAIGGGTITSDGGAAVQIRGLHLSWTQGFEKYDIFPADGSGTGAFICTITDLSPNKLYYVRAFATNSKGTAYGDTHSFTTLKILIDSVADIDGNIYHVVPIGNQSWLRENLRVRKYRNGDAIPNVLGDNQWKALTTGAFCTYENLAVNGATYGNLYNWHALSDARGLCPTGWHVPSRDEWAELGNYLGGEALAGGVLKSKGTIEAGTGLWYAPNTGATDSIGFTGLPGGYRIFYGTYYSISNVAFFWSSSDTTAVNAWNYVLDANNEELTRNYNFKTNGFSVRCCKD
jgi:uncharacterized protein (TIGR02145 family)